MPGIHCVWRRVSTVDLHVLTSSIILQQYFSYFTKQTILLRRPIVSSLPLWFGFLVDSMLFFLLITDIIINRLLIDFPALSMQGSWCDAVNPYCRIRLRMVDHLALTSYVQTVTIFFFLFFKISCLKESIVLSLPPWIGFPGWFIGFLSLDHRHNNK